MSTRFRLLSFVFLAMTGLCFGQTDFTPSGDSIPPAESIGEPESLPAPEDIPPPIPVPTTESNIDSIVESPVEPTPAESFIPRQPRNTLSELPVRPNGELNAWDFGVSLLPTNEGMKVVGVIVGGQAQAMGVKPNDVIVGVNGTEMQDAVVLVNEEVRSLSVIRNGVTIRLDGRNARQPQASSNAPQRTRAYSVPRTTYSAPQSYRYDPSYARSRAGYSYAAPGYSSTYRYSTGPRVSIGVNVGPAYGYGYPGRYGIPYSYGRFYGAPYGYGRPYGIGPYGRGRGRSGVGISVGGVGIRF